MRRRAAVIAWCSTIVVLASCGGGGQGASSSGAGTLPPAGQRPEVTKAATATAAQGDGPAVEITSPQDGSPVRAGSVTVEIKVKRFKIADNIGGEAKDGEGHMYYYLDVDEISTKPGEQARVTGEGRYAATTATSYTWPNVTPGEHKLGVQLVNNNQRPLQPPVTAEITVTAGG